MKPAARIQSVIEILSDVFEGKKPADTIVTDFFKARRFAGSKDRRAINERLYEILRSRAKINWIAQACDLDFNARNAVLINCVHNNDDVSDLFNGDLYAPTALDEVENNALGLIAQFAEAKMPASVALECPDWLEDNLRLSLGDNFERTMQALNQEAPLDLRINRLHPDFDNAQNILAQQNIEVEPTEFSPIGLRSAKKIKLGGIKAYKEGLIDIQDEGSQLISLLCQVKDCELVMDLCAGAGGKTLALGAEMENKGHLYALDISSKRLYKMRRRLERAQVNNVQLHPITGANDPWLKQFESRVDRLLIDAPCSGIGAWRRTPEARWKLTPELLDDMLNRQAALLKSAASLVKTGGRLIYATCSLLTRENQDQIDRFLKEHGNYRLLPIRHVWEETLNTPCPFDTDYMLMRPDLHQSDGFFCAVLERLK